MADELNIHAGDYVTLTSPEGRLTPYGMVPRSRRFRVAGVFDSGFYDYDANWAFATLASAQNLAGVGDVESVLEFRIRDVDRALDVARAIGTAAGQGFTTTTWEDENRALFRALHLEKLVTALFIGLITFVAGLNILVVLAMTVTDRASDIAVLMSLGAFRPQIRNIFMLQGLTVGVVGTVTGLIVGYTTSWAAGNLSFDSPLSGSVLGALRAISIKRLRRHVDRRRRDRHQRCGDADSGARRVADFAGRYPSVRVTESLKQFPVLVDYQNYH